MEGGDREFVDFTLPTLKAFLEARSNNVSGNKQWLVACAIGCPKTHFFYELAIFWSAKKLCKDFFFHTLHPLSTVIFATATVLAFVLLCNSRFNLHCYTQHEAMPTQKLAQKCTATSGDVLHERLQSVFILKQTRFAESPNRKGSGISKQKSCLDACCLTKDHLDERSPQPLLRPLLFNVALCPQRQYRLLWPRMATSTFT